MYRTIYPGYAHSLSLYLNMWSQRMYIAIFLINGEVLGQTVINSQLLHNESVIKIVSPTN